MNTPLLTRAAEGWDRRAFSVMEIFAMERAGILDDEIGYELWEGEIVPMSPKKNRHEIWKRELNRRLQRGLPDALAVAVQPSLYLSDVTFLEPDILIHETRLAPEDVRGAIEIADSSIARDLGPKARLYARHGVRIYWVLDAQGRRALVHADPGPEGYGRVEELGADAILTLPFEPALEIRLADLG
jgi:Uma2 family endonuclease